MVEPLEPAVACLVMEDLMFRAAGFALLCPAAEAINIRRDLVPLETSFRVAGLDALYGGTHREKSGALVERFEQATAMLIERIETRRELAG
jgi:hypothetical protein